MLELNARNFLSAVTELRHIQLLLGNIENKDIALVDADLPILVAHTDRMIDAINAIGARSAFRSADRLKTALEDPNSKPAYSVIAAILADVESRFADHLDDILLFVIADQRARLFADAATLMGDEAIVYLFPSATFELEEAAKCLALGRPTASAFHCMRMLEIGIAALSKHLDIADPVKATDRSWGFVLGKIKEAVDKQFPRNGRFPGSHGAELEGLFATLDAVKNPWRNATMHVKTVYTDADAQHILHCCTVFMGKLMARCDEFGTPLAKDLEENLDLDGTSRAS